MKHPELLVFGIDGASPAYIREAVERVLANAGSVMNRNARDKQREEMLA